MSSQILNGDSLDVLKTLDADSVDLLCTDPPYGYSFMGKAWDKALPDIGIFKECLRVLKPGAFAFVMSAPRSDVCSRMAILLEDAGFVISFTPIYWTYASGFPKAMNIGKMVDKRGGVSVGWFGEWLRNWRKENNITQKEIATLFPSKTGGLTGCVANWELGLNIPTPEQFSKICRHFHLPFESIEAAEREVVGKNPNGFGRNNGASLTHNLDAHPDLTAPATDAAKALDGSYGGFQPKPAVEVVIVAMKPLSEKTYVDQALKNGKGITWLDDCRVPLGGDKPRVANVEKSDSEGYGVASWQKSGTMPESGRFPANLLVSDDVLNDGVERKSGSGNKNTTNRLSYGGHLGQGNGDGIGGDSGSYSRFFSLDAWAQTLPFLAVPKASKGEKNRGLEDWEETYSPTMSGGIGVKDARDVRKKNVHPTVKPLKLMSYLITLGSRPGDVVLDPFLGSGTTAVAAKELGREYVGIERESEYVEIAQARIGAVIPTLV